jgi:teichuronic acid exporter
MSLKSSFWADVRWQAIGNAVAQLIGVLGMPILTRLYLPEHFAAQSVFLQVAMFFCGVMTWRYEYFVQLPKDHAVAQALIRLTLTLALVGTVLLTPFVWLVTHEFESIASNKLLSNWLWLTPATAALISISLAYQHRVQRFGLFKLSGLGEVAAKLGFVGSGAAAALLGMGALGLLLTTAAGTAAKFCFHTFFSNGLIKQTHAQPLQGAWLASIRSAAQSYWKLAASMLVSHLMGTITGLAPILYVGYAYGNAVLGQYSLVTMTIFLPASLIGNAIGQVFYQRAAQQWGQGQCFAPLWTQTFTRLALIGAPIHALVALASPWLYPAVFGANWADAGQYAVLISIAAFCAFVCTPMERSCLIVGRWRYQALWHAARAVTTLVVVAAAHLLHLDFKGFLLALVCQMSTLYLADIFMEWRFSLMRPPTPALP